MTSPQEKYISAQHPSGSFVIAATSEQFSNRLDALYEAIVENFGKGSVHLVPGAHEGIHFADVIMSGQDERHYEFDERLRLARPLAHNAMQQVIQNGLDLQLDMPELVGSSITMHATDPAQINIMRRFFGSIARVPDVDQPTDDAIELMELSPLVAVGEDSRISHFLNNGLMVRPIKSPFTHLQLWEKSTDLKKPAQIVDEIPFKKEG